MSQHRSRLESSPLRPLFSFLLQDWASLIALFQSLYRILTARAPSGIYEIIDYDSALELLDAHGHQAILRKRQKVRFLQDNIIAFQDFAWGEGNIFAGYRCTPGAAVDRYKAGDRWNILISLRETKKRGDVEEFNMERHIEEGFCQEEEYLQAEIRHHTRRLQLAVIFPPVRPCRRAIVQNRSRNETQVLGPEHFAELPDGRQIIRWETATVRRLEVYTLRWHW